MQAINRQVAHYSYHCGQIVFLAKHLCSRRLADVEHAARQIHGVYIGAFGRRSEPAVSATIAVRDTSGPVNFLQAPDADGIALARDDGLRRRFGAADGGDARDAIGDCACAGCRARL